MIQRFARILIVDDSRVMRKIIRQMLEGSGFGNIDEAADGREAYDLVAKLSYALVISDWNMSPMSGLELLTKLRAIPRTAKLPFIMATAKSQKRYGTVARDSGATHFIEKPFTSTDLLDRVNSIAA